MSRANGVRFHQHDEWIDITDDEAENVDIRGGEATLDGKKSVRSRRPTGLPPKQTLKPVRQLSRPDSSSEAPHHQVANTLNTRQDKIRASGFSTSSDNCERQTTPNEEDHVSFVMVGGSRATTQTGHLEQESVQVRLSEGIRRMESDAQGGRCKRPTQELCNADKDRAGVASSTEPSKPHSKPKSGRSIGTILASAVHKGQKSEPQESTSRKNAALASTVSELKSGEDAVVERAEDNLVSSSNKMKLAPSMTEVFAPVFCDASSLYLPSRTYKSHEDEDFSARLACLPKGNNSFTAIIETTMNRKVVAGKERAEKKKARPDKMEDESEASDINDLSAAVRHQLVNLAQEAKERVHEFPRTTQSADDNGREDRAQRRMSLSRRLSRRTEEEFVGKLPFDNAQNTIGTVCSCDVNESNEAQVVPKGWDRIHHPDDDGATAHQRRKSRFVKEDDVIWIGRDGQQIEKASNPLYHSLESDLSNRIRIEKDGQRQHRDPRKHDDEQDSPSKVAREMPKSQGRLSSPTLLRKSSRGEEEGQPTRRHHHPNTQKHISCRKDREEHDGSHGHNRRHHQHSPHHHHHHHHHHQPQQQQQQHHTGPQAYAHHHHHHHHPSSKHFQGDAATVDNRRKKQNPDKDQLLAKWNLEQALAAEEEQDEDHRHQRMSSEPNEMDEKALDAAHVSSMATKIDSRPGVSLERSVQAPQRSGTGEVDAADMKTHKRQGQYIDADDEKRLEIALDTARLQMEVELEKIKEEQRLLAMQVKGRAIRSRRTLMASGGNGLEEPYGGDGKTALATSIEYTRAGHHSAKPSTLNAESKNPCRAPQRPSQAIGNQRKDSCSTFNSVLTPSHEQFYLYCDGVYEQEGKQEEVNDRQRIRRSTLIDYAPLALHHPL